MVGFPSHRDGHYQIGKDGCCRDAARHEVPRTRLEPTHHSAQHRWDHWTCSEVMMPAYRMCMAVHSMCNIVHTYIDQNTSNHILASVLSRLLVHITESRQKSQPA